VQWSVAQTLMHVVPELSAALVTADAHRRVLSVASALPAALTRWMYLECRLAAKESQTDLIVRVEPVAARIAAELCAPAADILAHDSVVEGIWLEFDIPTVGGSAGEVLSRPGLFADLRPAIYARASSTERLQATLRVAEMVSPNSMSSDVTRAISRCVRALPAGAAIIYVGSFRHRPENGATRRVCIAGLEDRQLRAYLSRVGWPGSPVEWEVALRPFSASAVRPASTATMLHLDVGADIAPGISFELGLRREPQRRGRVAEMALLDALVDSGLCAPAKRDGLIAWPHTTIDTMPHELWPSVVTRRINHVKITVRPDGGVTAKAYLSASYRPLARSRTHVSIE
jgi:hypothetical protein